MSAAAANALVAAGHLAALLFLVLLPLHLRLRVRHRRCKAALERVAGERDSAQRLAWSLSQGKTLDQLRLLPSPENVA